MKIKIMFVFLCSFLLLAGCGKQSGERPADAGGKETADREETCYQADYTDAEFTPITISAACLEGNDVYILAGTASSGKERIIICRRDGSVSKEKKLKGIKEEEELLRLFRDEDGSLFLLTQLGSHQYLHMLDDGKLTDTIKLKTRQELYMSSSTPVSFFGGKLYAAVWKMGISLLFVRSLICRTGDTGFLLRILKRKNRTAAIGAGWFLPGQI